MVFQVSRTTLQEKKQLRLGLANSHSDLILASKLDKPASY